MSKPIAGNHNDLFDIEVYFEDITNQLTNAEISLSGLFGNKYYRTHRKVMHPENRNI